MGHDRCLSGFVEMDGCFCERQFSIITLGSLSCHTGFVKTAHLYIANATFGNRQLRFMDKLSFMNETSLL